MTQEKKQSKLKKALLMIVPILILAAVMYFMFRNNYKEIIEGLTNANLGYLLVMIIMGLGYYCLDAIPFMTLIKRCMPNFRFIDTLGMLFIGIFLNVTTMGAGIKPGEAFYLYKKGGDLGESVGHLILPYNYHKTAIMLFATIMLIFQGDFIRETFTDSYHYLYAGYGMTVAIVLALILMVVSKTFHKIVFWPLDRMFKTGKWYERKESWSKYVGNLREESRDVVRDWGLTFKLIGVDLVKMLVWYVMPYIAYYAVCGTPPAFTLIEIIAAAAFMQLIVGAIPNAGGMGTAEVVYTLIFSVLYGDVVAGTTMVLFRFATYYLPVLISIVVMGRVSRYLYKD